MSVKEYPFKVGVISDKSAAITDDGIWVSSGIGRLVEAISDRVTTVTLAVSRVSSRAAFHDCFWPHNTIHVNFLPELSSNLQGMWKGRECRRVVRQIEDQSDVVIVQLPFAAPTALGSPQKPRVYNICADIAAITKSSTYYRGLRKIAAVTAACGYDRFQRYLVQQPRARVVTHGEQLLKWYGNPPGRAIVSSTIREQEIASYSDQRAANSPFRVLFVGYLRYEKGIDLLLEAFVEFHRLFPHSELCLVGGNDHVDHGLMETINDFRKSLPNPGTISMTGMVAFGPPLFQCLANADVLVIASRSEGTPRVLVEARAFGCPVIATRVGGVPFSVEDGVDGLLVEPNSSAALCRALERLAGDRSLRNRLVENGYRRASQTTVEQYAVHLLEEAQALLPATGGVAVSPMDAI
jgi:glycosyltransferase involved in cell wall biosynthesis